MPLLLTHDTCASLLRAGALRTLRVENASIIGRIPTEIGQIRTHLEGLHISHNEELGGAIPTELGAGAWPHNALAALEVCHTPASPSPAHKTSATHTRSCGAAAYSLPPPGATCHRSTTRPSAVPYRPSSARCAPLTPSAFTGRLQAGRPPQPCTLQPGRPPQPCTLCSRRKKEDHPPRVSERPQALHPP